jgi:hypothetical protein
VIFACRSTCNAATISDGADRLLQLGAFRPRPDARHHGAGTEGIRDPLQRYSQVKAQVDAGSVGSVGGGAGRAERVPQAGEVNGTPCVRGHMV